MKYICLGYLEPGKIEGMTEAERHAVLDECFEHNGPSTRQRTSCCRSTSSASGDCVDPVLEKRQSRDDGWPLCGNLRNSLAAFRSLRRETSIMPFSLSHSNHALSLDLDRLRYGWLWI